MNEFSVSFQWIRDYVANPGEMERAVDVNEVKRTNPDDDLAILDALVVEDEKEQIEKFLEESNAPLVSCLILHTLGRPRLFRKFTISAPGSQPSTLTFLSPSPRVMGRVSFKKCRPSWRMQ